MKSIKNSNNKVLYLILFVGVLFIAVSVFMRVQKASYQLNGAMTNATITDIESYYDGDDYTHRAYVEFYVNGEKITGKLDYYTDSFKVGNTVPVLYMRDNPHNFIYGGGNVASVICFSIGLLLFSFGTVVFALRLKNYIKKKKFKESFVYGKVLQTVENDKFSLLNKRLTLVSAVDSNGHLYEKKIFLSLGQVNNGDTLKIYINPDNEEDFVFDIEENKTEIEE